MDKLIADFRKIIALSNDYECSNIISIDELESKLHMKKKEIIEKHKEKYNIWKATDGRWKTKVPDITKKAGVKLIAKSTEDDLLSAIIDWYTKDKTPTTLEELYPKWIKEKAEYTSKGNANKIIWVWEKYYKNDPIIKRKIADLKVKEVKNWFIDMIDKNSLTKRKYNELKSVLNMMLDYAIESEIVVRNVSRNVRNMPEGHFAQERKKSVTEQVYINDEENELIDTCLLQFEKTKNVAYLAICLNTALGLRVGELVALKTSDFSDTCIHIERQEVKVYIEKDGKYFRSGYTISDHTKTLDSVRDIPLTSISRYFYKMIVEINKSRGFESEYLLLNDKGERMNNDSINNTLRRVNRKMNTAQKGNHSIRKTCISKMNASRLLTDEELRIFAGHKHISTTQDNYLFPVESTDKKMPDYEKAINGKNMSVTECNQRIQQLKKVGSL